MEEKLYYFGFSLFSGVGAVKFQKLLQAFGSAKDAWNAKEKDLASIIGNVFAAKFILFRTQISLSLEWNALVKKQIIFLTPNDLDYPMLLKKIVHPPFGLYVKGDTKILNNEKTIGIVGTRKISTYGSEVTEMFTRDFVQQGFITVSGLAFGVDATVHSRTMDCTGKTIAVLGCGVDCCSPSSNQKIYDRIIQTGGAIVSTFKPSEQANKGSFPARNAIIAGLSLGILVTEGAADSGALITAEYAKKFDRPVFAIPGPITSSLSKGPNSLIQKGVTAVTNVRDILDRLGIITKVTDQRSLNGQVRSVHGETKEEDQVLNLLVSQPLHFDEIVRTIGKSTQEIGTLLTMMELKGLVKNNGGIYSL